MQRRTFIQLAGLGAIFSLIGIRFQSPLETWSARFRATITDAEELLLEIKQPTDPAEIATSIQALSNIADQPLHCNGSEVRGTIQDRPILLRFV